MFTVKFDFNDRAERGPEQVSAALSQMHASSVDIRNIDGYLSKIEKYVQSELSSTEYAYGFDSIELEIEQNESEGLHSWQIETEALPEKDAPSSNGYHDRWCAEHPDRVMRVLQRVNFGMAFNEGEFVAFVVLSHVKDDR